MFLDASLSVPHVGYALGRSYGSAVRRNRLRRQLRELMKRHESMMAPGVYVFGAAPRAGSVSFADLGQHLDRLIAKCASEARS